MCCTRSGMRGIAFWEVMNWETAEWNERGREQVIADLERIPATPGAGLSPHAPYSLDTVPLLDMPDIVRQRGQRLHIHLGESAFEEERVDTEDGETHRAWHFVGVQSFRALRSLGFGTSATDFVDRLGVLGPDCHVAHGVYMTAERPGAAARPRNLGRALPALQRGHRSRHRRPSPPTCARAARSRSARTRCRRARRST